MASLATAATPVERAAPPIKRRLSKPKLVVITSNKGGTGKTTTAINLAVAAMKRGHDVGCIDVDIQHSLSNWALRRRRNVSSAHDRPITAYAGRMAMFDALYNQAKISGHDIVFVDMPPGVEKDIEIVSKIIQIADYVIVPVQASILDLETCVPWLQSIKGNKGDNVIFLINRAKAANSVRDALDYLGDHGSVINPPIRDAIAISRFMITGESVLDSLSSKELSKDDYRLAWKAIEQAIGMGLGAYA